MRTPSYTKQFEKDVKRMKKRGKNLARLKEALLVLLAEESLGERFHDHPLIGNYRGRRECHLESDWLLIYKLDAAEIIFERTGTHADLFR